MATHKQAKKRNRQRLVRTVRNKSVRTRLRGLLREARNATEAGSDDAADLVKLASSMLDRARSKRVLPRKQVSRLKSRLAIGLNKALAKSAE